MANVLRESIGFIGGTRSKCDAKNSTVASNSRSGRGDELIVVLRRAGESE